MDIITRAEFYDACDIVDDVNGTASVKHTTEENAAWLFPTDPYLEYLRWLEDYLPDPNEPIIEPPLSLFERCVSEVIGLLEDDGSLYLAGYRTFITIRSQIAVAIQDYLGMNWISERHVQEAVKRKRRFSHE